MRFRTAVASSLAALFLACGGGPPTPSVPVPAASPDAGAKPLAVAPPDVSPVPAPPKLAIVMTVKNAEALQKSVRELASSTYPVLKAFTVDAAAQVFLGAAIADVIDLSKPIDVGMIEHNDTFAMSFAVSSIDDAKENLAEDFDLVPREGGVLVLTPHKGGEAAKFHCELRPAAGDSPYRLVCAPRPAQLRELGPYLARTVARDAPPDDVRIRLFADALAKMSDATPQHPVSSSAEAFGRKIASDGIADMNTFTIDGAIGESALSLVAQITFRSSKSPLTRIELTHAHDAKPLPDLFWRLPADSLGAFYARGAEVADLAEVKGWMLDMMGAGFGKNDWTERTKSALSTLFFTGGPVAAAYGLDIAGAVKTIGSAPVKPPPPRSAFHGWFIVGLEEPSSRWVSGIRAIDAVDRLPRKPTPQAPAEADAHPSEPTTTKMSEEPIRDTKLPVGTTHFVWREYALVKGQAGKTPKRTSHLYVLPDGSRTWLAIGENDAQVVAKAKEVLAASPGAGLASRADLPALHAATGFAGFVTTGLFDCLDGPEDGVDPKTTRSFLDRLSATPDTRAVPVSLVVPPSPAATQEVDVQVVTPKNVVMGILARLR